MYYVTDDDRLQLLEVPVLEYHHKEPNESWSYFTGIDINHDKLTVDRMTKDSLPKRSSEMEAKVIYSIIYGLKNGQFGKLTSPEQLVKLSEMQNNGEIVWNKLFHEMKVPAYDKMYSRMKDKYGEIQIQKIKKR